VIVAIRRSGADRLVLSAESDDMGAMTYSRPSANLFPAPKEPAQRRRIRAVLTIVVGGAALALGAGAIGQTRSLSMLDQLESGAWELRDRGAGAVANNVCIRGGRDLIQLHHPGMTCKSVVVEDTPAEVVVQYTCAGQGYGRTRIRRETNALIQIDTQGIANGQPYSYAGEGRRTGGCRN